MKFDVMEIANERLKDSFGKARAVCMTKKIIVRGSLVIGE
jgi:hypothetical protein